ncbi:unnamed protein product [Heligmosomoides polygyrus]|uniref:Reverse transcriptase domain-containing protein n=1 Tax=Heligmosomoides polygyrus TaxID=6339 RepID=A0A183G5N1_HELPZ|nr:unnamed protein product [Heligmosomoides polygyrus]
MDAISRDLQKPTPWTLLHAYDVMLASEDKAEFERQVQAWCDRLAAFGLKLNVKKSELMGVDGPRGYRGCYVRSNSAGGVRRTSMPGKQKMRVRVPPGARVLIATKHPVTTYSLSTSRSRLKQMR